MYRRPWHRSIAKALSALEHELLLRTKSYLSGDTAIVLSLDEYRETAEIGFLCVSKDGYRELRCVTFDDRFDALFPDTNDVKQLREQRTDQYGMRAP